MDLSRRYATVVLGLVFVFASLGYGQADPNTEKRINALISRMTLAEKLGQLQQLDSEGNGSAHPEEFEMVRKGLLGSTLGVRGAKNANDLQRAALQRVGRDARQEAFAAGLSVLVLKGGAIVEVHPDGTEKVIEYLSNGSGVVA